MLLHGGSACGRPTTPEHPPSAAPSPSPAEAPRDAPGTVFDRLEAALSRPPLRLGFALQAEGAVVASLAGSLVIDDEVDLRVKGQLGGAEHDLRLWTQGDHLLAGSPSAPGLDVPRPPALASALVVGLTRMGLLHNVAMLIAGRAPDGADGSVTAWVQTVEHARVEPPGDGDALRFVIVVSGQRVGEATLWLDRDGRPVRREQTVEFPDGQMRVVERYWPLAEPSAGG